VGDALPARPILRVVCGPTAAGKSALAMGLAERHGLAIVSADSRQVYRGFDVGTAKPTVAERAQVPHFGIDVAEPTTRYSAAAWADSLDGWIAEARDRGRGVVIVGGTGFYLRAVSAPLFAEPALDPVRRAAIADVLAPLSLDALRRWTEALDPARAHLGRTQLLRAVEVALLTGRRLSELQAEGARAPRYSLRYLVADPGAVLAERIAARTRSMFAAGWVDEVRALQRSVPADAPAWNAAGYEAVRKLACGELTEARAIERVVIETRQYAKRQRTWFRHQLPESDVVRINPDDARRDELADAWWGREEAA
jgi:tRNA dimethylallyltransferase